MREDGNTNKFGSIALGRKLKEYFGIEPKQLKIDGKNHNGFRFSSFDEMKQRIRDNYFRGENPFSDKPIEAEEVETEIGEFLSLLEHPAS